MCSRLRAQASWEGSPTHWQKKRIFPDLISCSFIYWASWVKWLGGNFYCTDKLHIMQFLLGEIQDFNKEWGGHFYSGCRKTCHGSKLKDMFLKKEWWRDGGPIIRGFSCWGFWPVFVWHKWLAMDKSFLLLRDFRITKSARSLFVFIT